MTLLPAVKRVVSSTGVRIYRIPCAVLPNLKARVHLLLGTGPPTLVDTGSGQGESTRHVLEGLKTVRTEFGEPVRAGDIKRILITHGHVDHIGGLAELVRKTRAKVGIHPFDCRAITACRERAAMFHRAMDRFLQEAGVGPARREKLCGKYSQRTRGATSVAVHFTLNDGDQLDGLRFIHTPGHSPGHVSISVGDVLLSGDHILPRTLPQQWPESIAPYTGLGHYFDSLETVRNMGGFDLAMGGHEPVMHDVYKRIDEIKASHLRKLDRVIDILQKARQPLSVSQITKKMYLQSRGFYALLALTDVGARVEYLHQRGQLAVANVEEMESDHVAPLLYQPA